MSFANKVVIVTGGSAGIGAAIVVHFAQEGAKIVIVGRNEVNLKKVAEKCQALNADYLTVKADVAKEFDARNIIEETIKKYGQLDILVNNAGIVRFGPIVSGEILKIYEEIMNINLRAIVTLTALASPHLIKSKGNIVNISSIAGSKVLSVGHTLYSTSKAAVNMFTVGSALELAPYGVRVNSVSPGPVITDILQNAGITDQKVEDWASVTALGRVSKSEEVADLVLFVASDKAKGITGSNFITDNGTLISLKL